MDFLELDIILYSVTAKYSSAKLFVYLLSAQSPGPWVGNLRSFSEKECFEFLAAIIQLSSIMIAHQLIGRNSYLGVLLNIARNDMKLQATFM